MCTAMLNLLISIISDEYDRVQATQQSTDLRAKCQILNEYGQIEQFFQKNVLRRKIERGELLYVHRFIKLSEHQSQGRVSQDGQWVGRLKTMTSKQDQIQDEIRDLRAIVEEKQDPEQSALVKTMLHRIDQLDKKQEKLSQQFQDQDVVLKSILAQVQQLTANQENENNQTMRDGFNNHNHQLRKDETIMTQISQVQWETQPFIQLPKQSDRSLHYFKMSLMN